MDPFFTLESHLSSFLQLQTPLYPKSLTSFPGARAAQVVPHVHFHIIPRPESLPELKSKSWTMFGRGPREELDDDEGEKIAAEMRRVLREEVERMEKPGAKL